MSFSKGLRQDPDLLTRPDLSIIRLILFGLRCWFWSHSHIERMRAGVACGGIPGLYLA